MNTLELLDAVKNRHGLKSDYALAKTLGLTQSAVSRYRSGRDYLGDRTALKVADLLDMDAAQVVASCHAERAKDKQERDLWESIMKRLGGIAAGLLLGFGLGGSPAPSYAGQQQAETAGTSVYYVKSRKRRRRPITATLRGLFPRLA